MPLRPVPIPPTLLARLAALDDAHDFLISRHTSPSMGPGRVSFRQRRIWEVRIWRRPDHAHAVITEDRSLAGALGKALDQAERRLALGPDDTSRRG